MDEEKKKFKRAAIAAYKQSFSLEKFIGMVGNPSPEGERAWRTQYAKAGKPFGDSEKGFAKFVLEMPG